GDGTCVLHARDGRAGTAMYTCPGRTGEPVLLQEGCTDGIGTTCWRVSDTAKKRPCRASIRPGRSRGRSTGRGIAEPNPLPLTRCKNGSTGTRDRNPREHRLVGPDDRRGADPDRGHHAARDGPVPDHAA